MQKQSLLLCRHNTICETKDYTNKYQIVPNTIKITLHIANETRNDTKTNIQFQYLKRT